jgi:hypothetical protein
MKWLFALICTIFLSTISEAQRPIEDFKTQLVYQRINKTLIERVPLYEKRAVCITASLIRNNAIQSIDESYLNFTSVNDSYTFTFTNESAAMDLIKSMIDNASFGCTIIGFFAIFVICAVLLMVLACVACLQN